MTDMKWYGDELDAHVDKEKVKLLQKIGLFTEGEAKRITVDLHAVKTGTLFRSISNEVNPWESFVRIGTNVEYAPYVFLGTALMPARPALRLALAHLKSNINQLMM